MKLKHTPGPWKTRKGFDSDTIEVFAPNPKIEKPFRPTALAVVEAEDAAGKANAKLIASSPELLAALVAAYNFAPCFHAMNAGIREEVNAAITKALGSDWQNAELCQPCPPSTPLRQETAAGQGLA